MTLIGYAATFEPYEMYGGPANCGWIEQIGRNAFDRTLREQPDLHLLVNHEGLPLARTGSGTLELSVDDHGLKVRAELDRSDPDVQQLEPKMRRGDMNEMSFAFRVKAQTWSAAPGYDDPQSQRTITEVSLHKGDVSVVNWGANPTTVAEVLGKRRKGRNGVKKTLTRAEMEAIMLADAKRANRSNRRSGKPLMTREEAEKQMAYDASVYRARQAIGRNILARAEEVLGFPPVPGLVNGRVTPKSIGCVDPGRITPADLGIHSILPHQRAVVEEMVRRAEAERELARQRDRRDAVAYMNPSYRPWK
ncbi:hypothetical protein A5649_13455 [Mycolicibacter heraklionensis]|uniref:Prohead serine protease domain-containing protein n=1 Tax=Mycolicibacter heraklionensis TaxID=512402 RepID=A0AA91F1Z0_9MYCO|nr:hypothetical protein A5649_13455 [Mycolicibacter heraklionensis]